MDRDQVGRRRNLGRHETPRPPPAPPPLRRRLGRSNGVRQPPAGYGLRVRRRPTPRPASVSVPSADLARRLMVGSSRHDASDRPAPLTRSLYYGRISGPQQRLGGQLSENQDVFHLITRSTRTRGSARLECRTLASVFVGPARPACRRR